MGTLYVVATPIGNLKDLTLRAIDTLREANVIICEDTRVTSKLLAHLGIENKSLIALNDYNESFKIREIIPIIERENSVALVSDAGTPLISDPGFKLVRECLTLGIPVVSVPGPSSVTAALSISGLPTDKFMFLGFLPQKSGHRQKMLENVRDINEIIKQTVIIFESPHRLGKTLEEMKDVYGDIEVVVARELTKVHEELVRGTISEVLDKFKKSTKGEIVILFNLSQKH